MRFVITKLLLPLWITSLSLAAPAFCQSAALSKSNPDPATTARISSLLDSLARVRTPQTVTISPDGTQLAWTVNGTDDHSELHLTGIAPKDSVQDAAWDRILSPDTIGNVTNLKPGRCTAAHPAWSPDGRLLAFLSTCDDGIDPKHPLPQRHISYQPTSQQNLFVWTLATNHMKQISHLHGEIADLQWSPDGKAIAFLFVENATHRPGATNATAPLTGVIGEDHIDVQRVFAMSIPRPGDTFSVLGYGSWISSDPKLHVYEFAWAPDSHQITYVAAPPPGENNWWAAKLYTQTVNLIGGCVTDPGPALLLCGGLPASDGPPQLLFDPTTAIGPLHGLQIAVPRFSPNGRSIAFIGGLMSDQGAVGGDIYL